MPRRKRVVVPGLAHHVTQRGNYQQKVFEKEADYRNYCYWVNSYAKKYNILIYAYCLMTNHVHFIVEPRDEYGLARFFNSVHMRYSQYKNKEKKVKGHLWQGRFYSCVLDSGHFYRAIRYVERNPVRAKMVTRPWDYVWSSAQTHVGEEKFAIIQLTSSDVIFDRENWKEYLSEEDDLLDKDIRCKTQKGLALGGEEFIIQLEKRVRRALRELPAGRPGK